MSNLQRFALSCAALLWAGVAQAGFVTVNFDPPTFVTGMPNVVGSAVPGANQLTTANATDGPVTNVLTFSTVGGNAFAAIVNLGVGHAPSGINGIGGAVGGLLTYNNAINVAFSLPTNSVSITGDQLNVPPGSTITLQAFSGVTLVATASSVDSPGGTTLTVTQPGATITSVRFFSTPVSGDSTVAFDNLTLNVVPEPTSVVMGLGGFVGVLGMVRRHRRLARNASAA